MKQAQEAEIVEAESQGGKRAPPPRGQGSLPSSISQKLSSVLRPSRACEQGFWASEQCLSGSTSENQVVFLLLFSPINLEEKGVRIRN